MYRDFQVELVEAPGSAIRVRLGAKQGCPCSPSIFAAFFDRVYAHVDAHLASLGRGHRRHLVQLLSVQLTLLLFADDVALVAASAEGLRELFTAFEDFCRREHLTVSEGKTKVVTNTTGAAGR